VNDLAPGIGHNSPPEPTIADVVTAWEAATILAAGSFRERAEALIASVNASKIDSPETAAQVATLGNMIRDHREAVESARKAAAKPFDDGKATVQLAYARGILDPLDAAIAACRKMLDAWRAKLAAQAAAEQRDRDAEAAEARRAAEEAEKARQTAQAAGDAGGAIRAEMEALKAAERAEKLETGEGAIRPEAMIRTNAGSAGTATQRVPVVTNIGQCLVWMIENQGQALLEAINPLIWRAIRAKMTIPGVEVSEVATTRFRR
jgi:tetratricopeptide (TPR) repeat protein